MAPQLSTRYVFSLAIEVGAPIIAGDVGYGVRRIIPILGGAVRGEGIRGTIFPCGLYRERRHPFWPEGLARPDRQRRDRRSFPDLFPLGAEIRDRRCKIPLADGKPVYRCRRPAPRPRRDRRASGVVRLLLPSPGGAGLSHVPEHIDEEAVVPGSAFELASQGGLCVGMSASNIEGKPAQNGEVGGSVVFSASRLILVENDVERPVQEVFDAPMFPNDAQQFCGRVALGQKEVALDGLVASTFAGNPRDGLEARKVVLFGHIPDRSNDRGSGFFAAVIGVLGGGLFGLLALCRRDGGLGIAQQARLVVLHRQDVISAALHDGFRHPAMTM